MTDTHGELSVNDVDLDVELVPIEPDGAKGPGEDQAEMRTFLGRRNVIRLGAPRYDDYLAEVLAESSALPKELERRRAEGYGFQLVRPTITLLPDRDCVFVAAELSLELWAAPLTQTAMSRPTAYDVQPTEVVEELPYSLYTGHSYEVGGEADAGIGKLIAKMAAENSLERNGVRVVRRLYGYGINFSEVGWRLQATTNHPLEGDVRDLTLVAQLPPGTALLGRFHVAAEIAVRTSADRWLTASFGPRRRGPVLEVTYPLSPF
ncbi:hypothetical protein [Micromonospora sp. DT63]|uniref:hypothetical protein n=1 Tax=Micromonospora sp. DT63 TaxID=3393441 RepID=UPI003CEAF393